MDNDPSVWLSSENVGNLEKGDTLDKKKPFSRRLIYQHVVEATDIKSA